MIISLGSEPRSADLLESRPWPAEILNQIAHALPRRSVALARAASSTFQQLADISPPGREERAHNLIRLSYHLSHPGRREEPLAASEQAVTPNASRPPPAPTPSSPISSDR